MVEEGVAGVQRVPPPPTHTHTRPHTHTQNALLDGKRGQACVCACVCACVRGASAPPPTPGVDVLRNAREVGHRGAGHQRRDLLARRRDARQHLGSRIEYNRYKTS